MASVDAAQLRNNSANQPGGPRRPDAGSQISRTDTETCAPGGSSWKTPKRIKIRPMSQLPVKVFTRNFIFWPFKQNFSLPLSPRSHSFSGIKTLRARPALLPQQSAGDPAGAGALRAVIPHGSS